MTSAGRHDSYRNRYMQFKLKQLAQRLAINKSPYKIEMIIGDNELTVFEFQEFWDKVKVETGISIDTVTGQLIKLKTNRKLVQLLTDQLYKIEEEFPESKVSEYDSKKQVSKKVVIRFFENFIGLLNKAYDENLAIGMEGE